MIFSNEKWQDADELRPYVEVSNSLSFRTVRTSLQNAFTLFIYPLLGEKMCTLLVEIYSQAAGEVKMDPQDKRLSLLYLAQRANVFLAFWYDYHEMQVLIGDSGVKRQESEKAQTPYKYQEQALITGWKNKGFDALDHLLTFLERHIEDFPEYRESEYYTESMYSIVRNTAEVNEYYFINSSRIVFLRLKAHFKVIEETKVAPRMGVVLYNLFKEQLAANTDDEDILKLRRLLIPVVVFYAVEKLIKETGSVTDRGLFFAVLNGKDDSYESYEPVSDERLIMQANMVHADAELYWRYVEKHLRMRFGVDACDCRKHPRRDNRNKRSFWA